MESIAPPPSSSSPRRMSSSLPAGISYRTTIARESTKHAHDGSTDMRSDRSASGTPTPLFHRKKPLSERRESSASVRSPLGFLSPNALRALNNPDDDKSASGKNLPGAKKLLFPSDEKHNGNVTSARGSGLSSSVTTRRGSSFANSRRSNKAAATTVTVPTVEESPGGTTVRQVKKRHKRGVKTPDLKGRLDASQSSGEFWVLDESSTVDCERDKNDDTRDFEEMEARIRLEQEEGEDADGGGGSAHHVIDDKEEEGQEEEEEEQHEESAMMEEEEEEYAEQTFEFVYPVKIFPPGANVIRKFHDSVVVDAHEKESGPARVSPNRSMIEGTQEVEEHAIELEGKDHVPQSHQAQLNAFGTGLLSLEDVILPAIANQENDALKKIQAKAQREGRGSTNAVDLAMHCRRTVRELSVAAIAATKDARLEREAEEVRQAEIRREEARVAKERRKVERRLAKERRIRERKRANEIERERKKRDKKKRLPRNVELWREVAFLMTERSRLEKEEKAWKEADRALDEQESELRQLKDLVEKAGGGAIRGSCNSPVITERDPSTILDTETVASDNDDAKTSNEDLETAVTDIVEDITLSTARIHEMIRNVKKLMERSETIQKELYDKYRTDHQFHGYQGVNNPKKLIRALTVDT